MLRRVLSKPYVFNDTLDDQEGRPCDWHIQQVAAETLLRNHVVRTITGFLLLSLNPTKFIQPLTADDNRNTKFFDYQP